jgi:hypothetical protein
MRQPIRLTALTFIAALGLQACDNASAPAAGGTDATTLASENETLKAKIATLEADVADAAAPHKDEGPAVYFVNLKDGQTVTSPVRVVFGLYGNGVAPALTAKEKTGHHHLLVDTELSDEEKQFSIPNDAQHIHFGGGQTETKLELTPGQHTLQLVFGDLNHELHKPTPIMSQKITITVK